MSENIKNKKTKAKEFHDQALAKAENGDFAYKLAARSIESHIDELSQTAIASEINPAFEMLDFRLMATHLKTGSAPLDLVANFIEEIRKTFGLEDS